MDLSIADPKQFLEVKEFLEYIKYAKLEHYGGFTPQFIKLVNQKHTPNQRKLYSDVL